MVLNPALQIASDAMAKNIIEISYQNSNPGYARPDTKGLIKMKDNTGIKIKTDKDLKSSFSMI